jgi:urease accessory protein
VKIESLKKAMLEVHHLHAQEGGPVDDLLELPYELRCRARFRAVTQKGVEVGLFLERGHILDEGDILLTDCGKRIGIKAALESVATLRAADWQSFARACYHLGNRHVPLQIGERWARMQPDHVLEEMVTGLGLEVVHERQPFRPEPGAYKSGGHSHGHAHAPHDHSHSHPHGHEH